MKKCELCGRNAEYIETLNKVGWLESRINLIKRYVCINCQGNTFYYVWNVKKLNTGKLLAGRE